MPPRQALNCRSPSHSDPKLCSLTQIFVLMPTWRSLPAGRRSRCPCLMYCEKCHCCWIGCLLSPSQLCWQSVRHIANKSMSMSAILQCQFRRIFRPWYKALGLPCYPGTLMTPCRLGSGDTAAFQRQRCSHSPSGQGAQSAGFDAQWRLHQRSRNSAAAPCQLRPLGEVLPAQCGALICSHTGFLRRHMAPLAGAGPEQQPAGGRSHRTSGSSVLALPRTAGSVLHWSWSCRTSATVAFNKYRQQQQQQPVLASIDRPQRVREQHASWQPLPASSTFRDGGGRNRLGMPADRA